MLAAVAASSLSFQAPAAGMLMQPRAAVPAMALEDMVGKYSIAKTVFDPLDLASKYDLNWLREAEIK